MNAGRKLMEASLVDEQQRAEANILIQDAAVKGIIACYGGGSRNKGHGFWLYPATPTAIKDWVFCGNLTEAGPCILNDGKASGNPNFHMFQDARAYINNL